jgi:hypothetical protein
MMTIVDAGVAYGYSREDHLISQGPARSVIGRRARTLREALRLVRRAAEPGIPRLCPAPVWVVCRTDQGDLVRYDP